MMPERQRYFDRSGRELSRAEALENGSVLKDGVSLRVHMNARDSARTFWDANRDSLLVVDPRRVGGVEQGCRPGFRVLDNDLGRQAKLDAYQQYEAELTSAYRNPPGVSKHDARTVDERECPDCNGEGEHANGESCARCDGTGELPDDDDNERPQGQRVRPVTADAIANHQRNMARIYDAYAAELSQAWRKR